MKAPRTHELRGIRFTPPVDFVAEDVSLTLRAPPIGAQKGAKHPIRPNVIVTRRKVSTREKVEVYAAEIGAELLVSMPNLTNLSSEPFTFDDRAPGYLLSFNIETTKGTTIRQIQAIRLDGATLTTLTLTTDIRRFDGGSGRDYLRALQSAVLAD